MRSNPNESVAAYRESMRHPRPSARITRRPQAERPFTYTPTYPVVDLHHLNGEPYDAGKEPASILPAFPYVTAGSAPDFAAALKANHENRGGSFVVEMRAFLAASSPEEIAAAIRYLFTDAEQATIVRLIQDGDES